MALPQTGQAGIIENGNIGLIEKLPLPIDLAIAPYILSQNKKNKSIEKQKGQIFTIETHSKNFRLL
ncbi:MAG: hypothetical protein DRJ05_03455 [Bacteroidetes bacterium]|nr:MAG: hypothetical protein DRJ05_03455 [Bacteroidota bacterium]